MRITYLIAALLLIAAPAHADWELSKGLTRTTVAGLGACTAANDGVAKIVTNGADNTDCTAGGASAVNICVCDGGAWVFDGDGAGGGLPGDPAACPANEYVTDQDISGVLTCSTDIGLPANPAHCSTTADAQNRFGPIIDLDQDGTPTCMGAVLGKNVDDFSTGDTGTSFWMEQDLSSPVAGRSIGYTNRDPGFDTIDSSYIWFKQCIPDNNCGMSFAVDTGTAAPDEFIEIVRDPDTGCSLDTGCQTTVRIGALSGTSKNNIEVTEFGDTTFNLWQAGASDIIINDPNFVSCAAIDTGAGGELGCATPSNVGGGLASWSSALQWNTFDATDFDLAANLISIDDASWASQSETDAKMPLAGGTFTNQVTFTGATVVQFTNAEAMTYLYDDSTFAGVNDAQLTLGDCPTSNDCSADLRVRSGAPTPVPFLEADTDDGGNTSVVLGINAPASTNLTIVENGNATLTLDTGTQFVFNTTKSIRWEPREMAQDGSNCVAPTQNTLNGGPIVWSFSCADSASSIFYGSTVMPDGWDGGTVTLELTLWHGTSESITFAGDFSAQCRGAGEAVNSTWGTVQSADVAITTANQIAAATTAALTPNSPDTCAGGDVLFWRYVVDDVAFDTNAANAEVLGVKMEYTTTSND